VAAPASQRSVVFVDGIRTPFGKAGPKGMYAETRADDLVVKAIRELLRRNPQLDPARIDEVAIAATTQTGDQGLTIGRTAGILAGLPETVPGFAIDRMCAGAMTAVTTTASGIGFGQYDVVIAGGVEHMGHVPIDSPAKISELYGDPWTTELRDRYAFVHQGESAELIADRWQLGREDMDAFAARSHQSAAKAIADGRFVAEMVPMTLDGQLRQADQCVRPETTVETLASLKPVFRKENGRITAGSSSPISDGAAAVLLCSGDAARRLGLRVRARIVDQTTVGVDPIIMLTGPIPATWKLLQRNNLSIDDIDLFEVNEAFSSVVLAWQRELRPDVDRVNVNGGAIALGHAVGATGARLIATLVAELDRREGDLGLVTMCCGGGLGTGTLIQRVPT